MAAGARKTGRATTFLVIGLLSVAGAYVLRGLLPLGSGFLFELGFWCVVLAVAAALAGWIQFRAGARNPGG